MSGLGEELKYNTAILCVIQFLLFNKPNLQPQYLIDSLL